MQGTIAQIVALVVHGNGYFSSGGKAVAFPTTHSTLQFCEFVEFVDLKRAWWRWSERRVAADPAAWIEMLHRNEVRSLQVVHLAGNEKFPDRMLAGFVGGGGRWLLEATTPTGCDYWEARWNVGDRDRADRRIWRVTYGRLAAQQPFATHAQADLADLKRRLASTLSELSVFARNQGLDGFAGAFEKGMAQLESPTPELYHADLLSNKMQLEAAQLLAAVSWSWVFGGMGSWNDLAFDGDMQAIYERLSDILFRQSVEAVVSAANSTAHRDSG